MIETTTPTPVSSMRLLGDWQDISTAPKDGTRFMARLLIPATHMNRWDMKDRYSKKITWWGKTSHVPLYGWCHGFVENVDLWNPTAWKPLKAKSPNGEVSHTAGRKPENQGMK